MVVSSNHVHCEVYSIQHYVIKFVIELRHVLLLSLDTPNSSDNKSDQYDITGI